MKTSTQPPTILDALADPAIFGALFPVATWAAWRAFLVAVFGLKATKAERDLILQCTGCTSLPARQASAVFCVVGRRGGKSRIAALLAVFLACFRDYRNILTAGERGVVMLIASDRKQAGVLKRYVSGLLQAVPMLQQLVVGETTEGIQLTNRVVIEIHTASFRAVRGYTVVAAVLDELAFWPSDDAANPDVEIINALKPAMATVPEALLVAISSPYARRGALYQAYRDHFGKASGPLVWQADTRTMNSTVPQSVIDQAYVEDAASAAAEYGAEFRRDVESFIACEVIDSCVVAGQYELPPEAGLRYWGFVDPSGGSQDSFTMGIAHHAHGLTVLDLIREVTPPFSPEQVVTDFTDTLRRYGLTQVTGDRYGGEWPREQFRKHGVEYLLSTHAKSDIYRDLLPLLNSTTITLLDHPRLLAQLGQLERRTARGGKDSIDHPPHAHDDVINSAAGALVLAACASARAPLAFLSEGRWIGPSPAPQLDAPWRTVTTPTLIEQGVTMARRAVKAVVRAVSPASVPTRKIIAPVPYRSIETIERLDEGVRSTDEQERLDEHYVQRQRSRKPSDLEQYLRAGHVYFPGDQIVRTDNLQDVLEAIRLKFKHWR